MKRPFFILKEKYTWGFFHIIFCYILPSFNRLFSKVCDRKLDGKKSLLLLQREDFEDTSQWRGTNGCKRESCSGKHFRFNLILFSENILPSSSLFLYYFFSKNRAMKLLTRDCEIHAKLIPQTKPTSLTQNKLSYNSHTQIRWGICMIIVLLTFCL